MHRKDARLRSEQDGLFSVFEAFKRHQPPTSLARIMIIYLAICLFIYLRFINMNGLALFAVTSMYLHLSSENDEVSVCSRCGRPKFER